MTTPSIRCITPREGHYFHGFYNIQPWDETGRYFLCHRAPFIDRMPQPQDEVEIGVIDLPNDRFEPFAHTRAWNFQLGSLMHWLGETHPGAVIYNVREEGRIASVIHHLASGKRQTLDSPIFTLSRNMRFALGFNLGRPHAINPGYAYAGVEYALFDRLAPQDEGLNLIDLATGKCTLIISFAELAERYRIPAMDGQPIIFGRILPNADDTRLVFSFRFRDAQTNLWTTSLVTANLDGTNLWQIVPFHWQPAHFDWHGSDELLVWCQPPGAEKKSFHLVKDFTHQATAIAKDTLHVDGHCCFSPDRTLLASDTFPDAARQQTLMMLDADGSKLRVLGKFDAPPEWRGDLRCDLHPCWNRQGNAIAFDSLHEGRRAVYVAELIL